MSNGPYGLGGYGLVGDDITDDTDALQRWMNDGAKVPLMEGATYRITRPLRASRAGCRESSTSRWTVRGLKRVKG